MCAGSGSARLPLVSTGLALLTFGVATGCASSDPAASSAPPSTPTVGPTAITAGPVAPSYRLTAGSRLNIQSLGHTLAADSGTLTIEQLPAGASRITVTATSLQRAREPGRRSAKSVPVAWSVVLEVGSNSKTLSGQVQVGTQQWTVLPNTGAIGSVVTSGSVQIWTALAATVNFNGTPPNNPMTVTFNATADAAGASAEPTA